MTREERNNKLKYFITCMKCEVSGKCCDENCPIQYDAGNMGEIIENLEEISKILEEKEPCEDAISREAVKELFQEGSVMGMYHFLGIDELPSVTPARKKGKWIVLKDEYGDICEAICSCCEDNGNHRWKYCHTCGAEMESKE